MSGIQRESQGFLLELSDALRPLADPVAIQETAMRLIGQRLDADRAYYWEVDDEGVASWTHGYSNGRDQLPQRVKLVEFGVQLNEIYVQGRNLVLCDVSTDKRFSTAERAAWRAAGLSGGLGVPLMKETKLRAILGLNNVLPREWTAAELSLAEDVAERTWAAVERARAEAALRASESRLRASEERSGFLLKLYDALRPLNDPAAIEGEAARVLGEHLNSTRAYYVEIDARAGEYLIARDWHRADVESQAGRYRLQDWPMPWLENGKPWVVRDTATDPAMPAAQREGYLINGTRAMIVVPILKQGKLIATFLTIQDAPRDWTTSEIALVEETSDRIWSAVVRARAESALRESEARLASVLAQVPIGVALFDADGRYTLKNPHARDLVGDVIPSLDVSNSHMWEALDVAGKRVPLHEYPSIRALRGEATLTPVDFHRVDSTGERWLRVTAVPVRDGSGTILGGVNVINDVTAERKIQARLQALAARNNEILESISDAFYAVDSDWRFTYVNRKAEELWAHTRSELLGQSIWDVFNDAIGHEASRALRRAAKDRQMIWLETRSPLSNRWIDLTIYPSSDGGLSIYLRDITPRRQAEKRLRESEARFREFAEASSDVIWFRDAQTLLLEYASPAFQTIAGMDPGELFGENDFQNWLQLIHPEDRDRVRRHTDEVRKGERATLEFRIVRPGDGAIRWLRDTSFPVFDENSRVQRLGGISHDVTELRRMQDERAERELEQRIQLEGMPQLVWRAGDKGFWTWASPQWVEFTGQAEIASHGLGWLAVVHPDDHDAAMAAWRLAPELGKLDVEFRIFRASDGAWIWHHTRSVPAREQRGGQVEWLGTSTDMQELKALQSRQNVLLVELQHRTGNLMTIVRATMDASLRDSAGRNDFVAAYRRRLDAIARAQDLLSRLHNGDRVAFDQLLRGELAAVGMFTDGVVAERVTLSGVSGVRLRSAHVQTLALTFHELAHHARTHGALSQHDGYLTVSWRVIPGGEDSRLRVSWTETGVADSDFAAAAYGRELIKTVLPNQLRAETSYALRADNLECTIDLALFDATVREEMTPG